MKGIAALIGLMSTKGFHAENYFGKLLFPRLHSSQYNQQFKIIAATLSLGLIVAGVLGAVMIWRGAANR